MLSDVAHCVAPLHEAVGEFQLMRERPLLDLTGVFFFTALAFVVMGYHPGLEDDGIYLAAVKADLNPALFPHGANFFRLQLEATVFDGWMAHFVRWTGIPLAWAELIWQLAGLFLILWAIKMIANRLFAEERTRWAGVAMVAAMFTLPVAGTALYLVDQHLHPRTLATAMILLAVSRILNKKHWQAALLLLLAVLFHPLMAAFGISFCAFLTIALSDTVWERIGRLGVRGAAAFLPLGWVFEASGPGWRKALNTKRYLFLFHWTWYEWLGALAPLVFFFVLWRISRNRGQILLSHFAAAVFAYGVFQQAVALVMLSPPSLVRLASLQPMRYLHLIYFLLAMTAGCLLGKFLLKRKIWRWALFLLVSNGGMYAAQRGEFVQSSHVELPERAPENPWLEAFAWIRENTPENAYFALDPYYLQAQGEDYHSFSALAERSQLADAVKDAAVVIEVPELGAAWQRQVEAQQGWQNFKLADFERLKAEFGIDWVLVSPEQTVGLVCRWHNRVLAVCEIR
jgi:hypothetical protein